MSLLSDKIIELENIFKPLSVFPALNYSTVTKQWYVSIISLYGVFIHWKGGDYGIIEHRDTPEDAIDAYVKELQRAEFFYIAKQSLHTGEWYPLQYKRWDVFKRVFVDKPMPTSEIPYSEVIEDDFFTIEQMVDWIASNRDNPWALSHESLLSADGTSIQRVEIPFEFARQCLPLSASANAPKSNSYNVWCVGVGNINQEKEYFYGWTMAEALKKAIQQIKIQNKVP